MLEREYRAWQIAIVDSFEGKIVPRVSVLLEFCLIDNNNSVSGVYIPLIFNPNIGWEWPG